MQIVSSPSVDAAEAACYGLRYGNGMGYRQRAGYEVTSRRYDAAEAACYGGEERLRNGIPPDGVIRRATKKLHSLLTQLRLRATGPL